MNILNIEIPIWVKKAMDKLNESGYEAYVVGGCLRDSLLGKEPDDWDIATSATPAEVKDLFKDYHQLDTGLKHGTVMVIMDKRPIEITTYRIEDGYSDGRRPDRVIFTRDIIEDLARRDYTINALAMGHGQILDPFGGRKDLNNQLIRCVGNPRERFTEDALRILRGIRFAAVLGFEVEEETKGAMLDLKALLQNISMERITAEFAKTLLGLKVRDTLIEFKDIVLYLLPEARDMVGFDQQTKYHIYDVYDHSLRAVESIDREIVLRTTMFFHDIGKPRTFFVDQKDVGHFYGHAEISAEMTRKILKRMRFSNGHINEITQLIRYHDREMGLTSKSVRRLLSKLGETQYRRLLKVKRADAMAKNPVYLKDKLEKLDAIEEILEKVLKEEPCIALKDLAIDGRDLMKLGLTQGKEIGRILNKLLDMVINEELDNKREDLLKEAASSIGLSVLSNK